MSRVHATSRHALLAGLALTVLCVLAGAASGASLPECREAGGCTLEIQTFPSRSFTYRDETSGTLVGFEVDLAKALAEDLSRSEGLDLDLEWVEINSFRRMYQSVLHAGDGVLAISQISANEDRRKELDLSRSYLRNVMVLASRPGLDPIGDWDLAKATLGGFQGLAIPGTTHETATRDLVARIDGFSLGAVENGEARLQRILASPHLVGYFDLPQFLRAKGDGAELVRHSFADLPGDRYSIALPKGSTWTAAIDRFLNDFVGSAEYLELLEEWFGSEGAEELRMSGEPR